MISPLPTSSPRCWIWLLALFAIVMGLTMWKDWWLTGEEPNILFYISVPLCSLLGSVLGMFWVVKVTKGSISFLELLAIIIGVNLVMQSMEIILKVIHYRVWEYPGWLYIAIVIPSGFLLGVYSLAHWGRVGWGKAILLMAVGLAGELIAAGLVTSVFGLSTPGS